MTVVPSLSCKTCLPSLLKDALVHDDFFFSISLTGSPCEHGGTCVNMPGSYRCDCLPGFKGRRCEMNINECESNPCQNEGTCIDERGGFRCICMPGELNEFASNCSISYLRFFCFSTSRIGLLSLTKLLHLLSAALASTNRS